MVPVYSWGSGGWACVRLPCVVSWFVVGCRGLSWFVVVCRRLSSSCRRNAVPVVKVANSVVFGCFKGRHVNVLCHVSKIALRGRRHSFATFPEDACQFSCQAQHFGRVHLHYAWQAQHFRHIVFLFFGDRIVRAA